ncbi:MAG: bifunctional cobalt-precorrin-7 (C(5))-methyltransferase/cobalt-precorrin-6B (C(15))-methyltransferase, partial [Roseiflexus sp.]
GGRLVEIIRTAQQRLRPQGHLVLHLVVFDHVQQALALLPEARMTQAQINRSRPIQSLLRLEALNPVFIVVWRKANQHG